MHTDVPLLLAITIGAILNARSFDERLACGTPVLHGPASTFWGNASGGVLYLSTRPPPGVAPRVRLRQIVGSYGLSKTGVQVTPALGPHRLSAYGSYLTLEYEATGAYFVNNENTARTGGYVVFDVRLSHPGIDVGGGVALYPFFEVNNLLDVRYVGPVVVNGFGGRYYGPAAGRHWRARVSLQFD